MLRLIDESVPVPASVPGARSGAMHRVVFNCGVYGWGFRFLTGAAREWGWRASCGSLG